MPREQQRGWLKSETRSDGETWVFCFRCLRPLDGRRVEKKVRVGLVEDFPEKSDAWAEVERLQLHLLTNQENPVRGPEITFADLAESYIKVELGDQSAATIEKAYSSICTYLRYLKKYLLPRFGSRTAGSIGPVEVENWLRDWKKRENLKNSTLDKIRRVMDLTFKHGQRYGLLPRTQEANPMRFVRQRTKSDYEPITVTPEQAFEIILSLEEPERTLTLIGVATGLRISEILALIWEDVDFENQRINVRHAYVWGKIGKPKSKASRDPVPLHPLLAGCLLAWRKETPYAKPSDFVFPSFRLHGKKPRAANSLVADHLRPAAEIAGVLKPGDKRRFGFHNLRHSLASTLVMMNVDPKTVQRTLRHSDVRTTLQLYVHPSMDAAMEAQGKFLEKLVGDRGHLLRPAQALESPPSTSRRVN